MRILALMLLLITVDCAEHNVAPHTLLHSACHRLNVWSYQPVAGEGFVTRPLRDGGCVVLDGGAVIAVDGSRVSVNGKPLSATDAVVDRNGDVFEGAFIRTFD